MLGVKLWTCTGPEAQLWTLLMWGSKMEVAENPIIRFWCFIHFNPSYHEQAYQLASKEYVDNDLVKWEPNNNWIQVKFQMLNQSWLSELRGLMFCLYRCAPTWRRWPPCKFVLELYWGLNIRMTYNRIYKCNLLAKVEEIYSSQGFWRFSLECRLRNCNAFSNKHKRKPIFCSKSFLLP